jgi:chromosome segregation ATPase
VAPLREQHEREQATLEAVSAQANKAQGRVDALSTELVTLDEAIERTKQQMARRATELSGTAPLDAIRNALRSLRSEVTTLGLREAMLTQQLTARRAVAAARGVARSRARDDAVIDRPASPQADSQPLSPAG